jgi:hypothetical protein
MGPIILLAASAHAVYAENISASITPDSSTKTEDAYLLNPLEIIVGDIM